MTKVGAKVRFDVDALRDLAGDKVFARGQAYHRQGAVQILAFEQKRVLAQVAGTEDYHTMLTGRGAEIEGDCSCPAFEDWGFCKHMVATALAANAWNGPVAGEGADGLAHIRAHLKDMGADALVELIVELAARDPVLFRKLDMAASLTRADDRTLEARLRKAIDGATRTGDYVHYREAPAWAAGVDAALDALADLAPAGRGVLALTLAEHAIERIEAATESIDDSNGHCGALLHRAREIHLAAASVALPEPVQLARDLFAREVEGDYDTFVGAAGLYAEVLGEAGLSEYRRLATEAWEKLSTRSGPVCGGDDFAGDYYRLAAILDGFAELEGDVDARIALRSKDLSSPWSYLQLAEFCASHGRERDALRHAEEGLWLFEDRRPDQRLAVHGRVTVEGRPGRGCHGAFAARL